MNIPYGTTNHLTLSPARTYEDVLVACPTCIMLTETYPNGSSVTNFGEYNEVQLFIYDQATGKRTPSLAIYVNELDLIPKVYDPVCKLLTRHPSIKPIIENGFGGRVKREPRPDNQTPIPPTP